MGWEIFKITNIDSNDAFLQSVSQNMSPGAVKARVLAADICQTSTCTEKFEHSLSTNYEQGALIDS